MSSDLPATPVTNHVQKYTPSLQELKSPTISYKDRKFLMLLYTGKLKKGEKLRRLILRGYAEFDAKGEIVPTILGSLLIDFTVRVQEKARNARKNTPRQPARKNRINTFGQRRKRDIDPVLGGELSLGDSSGTEADTLPSVGAID